MLRRSIIGCAVVAALCAAVLAVAGLAGPAAARQPAQAARPPLAHASGTIVYSPDAVVIPAAVVRSQLAGIAPNGVFKFKHAVGPLAQLKVGSVMVLQGSATGIVTAVRMANGQLVVTTKGATLGQVIKSGTISIDTAPDFTKAFSAPIDLADGGLSANRIHAAHFVSPGFPYVPGAHVADATNLAIQGGSGPWGYSISGSVKGPHQLDLSGTVCLGYNGADDCGNGPSKAVAVSISFSGTLDLDKLSADLQVGDGKVEKLSSAFSGISSQFKMNYTFSRGPGPDTRKLPPIHIPIGWDIPLPNPYVPLFARVQFGALLQVLSKPAKNTVAHGAMSSHFTGTASASDSSGKTAPGPATGAGTSGEVNPGNQGLGISLAPLGIDVTLQQKLGLALGVSVANLMAFTDLTDTIGQEQSSAIAGGFCSSYLAVLDWGVGLGAELGGGVLGAQLTKRWSLLQKNYHYTEPGCRPVSG